MTTRRHLRALTLRQAAEWTGLPVRRLDEAVRRGEIAAFRERPLSGRTHTTTTRYLLEQSLEAWFLARVSGGEVRLTGREPVPDELRVVADPDDELLREIPKRERLFA